MGGKRSLLYVIKNITGFGAIGGELLKLLLQSNFSSLFRSLTDFSGESWFLVFGTSTF